jgi:hypothetical protein
MTMPSRGIGAVMDSKMPKAKTITRKDDPNKVEMFKRGGLVCQYRRQEKTHRCRFG